MSGASSKIQNASLVAMASTVLLNFGGGVVSSGVSREFCKAAVLGDGLSVFSDAFVRTVKAWRPPMRLIISA